MEEKREKEERDQQRRAKKLNKKNVLPPPPPSESVDEQGAGRLKAVREEEEDELEADPEGVHGEGMNEVNAAVETKMNMAQRKQENGKPGKPMNSAHN